MSTPNEPNAPQEPQATPPTQARQPVAEPGTYYAGQPVIDRTQLPPFNVMALITFIGSFVIPVVGIVCGHITLAEYRRGLPERGREYAKAGLILGYIFTAIWVVLAIIWIVFVFTHFGHSSVVTPGNGGQGGFGNGGNGFGGSGNGGGTQQGG